MSLFIKKLFFTTFFNSSLFVLLLIGIQNSTNKAKVNLLFNETVELPISFIMGSSFILGSTIGALFDFNIHNK